MAFWKKNEDEFTEMAEIVKQQPGISAREIARQMGVAPSTIIRRLPNLDDVNILFYEDEQGRLWPFDKDDLE